MTALDFEHEMTKTVAELLSAPLGCHIARSIGLPGSGHETRHHQDDRHLQNALCSRKADIDSVNPDDPVTIRIRSAQLKPNTQAIWQQKAQAKYGHDGN